MATKRAETRKPSTVPAEAKPPPEPVPIPTSEQLMEAIAKWRWCVSEYQRVTIESNVARRELEDMLKALGVRQDMIPR